jgi:hypothetical protein
VALAVWDKVCVTMAQLNEDSFMRREQTKNLHTVSCGIVLQLRSGNLYFSGPSCSLHGHDKHEEKEWEREKRKKIMSINSKTPWTFSYDTHRYSDKHVEFFDNPFG